MPTARNFRDICDNHGHGIYAIDTDYMRPRLDAAHLIVRNGRAAFVDTGTALSVPNLLTALEGVGVPREAVDYVLVTHVHLDHAGGAGALLRELPNARMVVHPRGAPHMVDPAKLEAGTIQVYGEEGYREHYGEMVAADEDRVVEAEDGQRLRLGESELELIFTPGHALHHYCVVDPDAQAVFAGDTFGVSYRELDTDQGPFIMAATTPVHFDPEALKASIDRIMSYRPRDIYLTHYSRITATPELAEELKRDVDGVAEIALQCGVRNDQDPSGCIVAELRDYYAERLRRHGSTLSEERVDEIIGMDTDLNAQGLAVWLKRLRVG